MINIKELSELISIAQDNVVDQNLYYDEKQKMLIFQNEDCSIDDYNENENMILINVKPFGRDMFLEFFETITNTNVRDMFKDFFHGSKKYRKVKNLFPRYHLLEAFYAFQDRYQLEIAKQWCIENKVNYIDLDGKEIIVDRERLE